jgi:hypothetical protein
VGGVGMNVIWDQAIQLTGAVLILAAFAGTQAGWLSHKSPGYLLTNMVGSAGLAAVAVPARQWGFLLLEGAWSITALSARCRMRIPHGKFQPIRRLSAK